MDIKKKASDVACSSVKHRAMIGIIDYYEVIFQMMYHRIAKSCSRCVNLSLANRTCSFPDIKSLFRELVTT